MSEFLVPTNDDVDDVWTQVEFDASSWSTGPMGVGYENSAADYAGLIQSRVPLGTDTAYVRVPFDVEDPTELDSLTLRVRYDDGFIAYLNGPALTGCPRKPPPIISTTDPIATGNHPDEDAVSFVPFDVTDQLDC